MSLDLNLRSAIEAIVTQGQDFKKFSRGKESGQAVDRKESKVHKVCKVKRGCTDSYLKYLWSNTLAKYTNLCYKCHRLHILKMDERGIYGGGREKIA